MVRISKYILFNQCGKLFKIMVNVTVMSALASDSNSYSLFVGCACLRKQTDVRHAAAWKQLDLNLGPPDTKQPLYHLCYLAFDRLVNLTPER